MTALAFVLSLPRRGLTALGLWPRRARAPRIGAEDITRLEAVASRFADAEEMIEMRFAEMRERQAQQFSENNRELAELAERIDFAERVLAQQRSVNALESPDKKDVVTPA